MVEGGARLKPSWNCAPENHLVLSCPFFSVLLGYHGYELAYWC